MGWFDAAATYRSGKTPKYKVGDKVYKLLVIPAGSLIKESYRSSVYLVRLTGVSTKKSGFIFREFTYTVKSDRLNCKNV